MGADQGGPLGRRAGGRAHRSGGHRAHHGQAVGAAHAHLLQPERGRRRAVRALPARGRRARGPHRRRARPGVRVRARRRPHLHRDHRGARADQSRGGGRQTGGAAGRVRHRDGAAVPDRGRRTGARPGPVPPRKYLLGLAEAMTASGAQIYEHTRAVRLDSGKVTTADGLVVTADDVVVATHYPVFDRALLFARMTPRRELVVAAPIEAAADPRGTFITTEQGTRSVRTAPLEDGRRLLLVTGEKYRPGEGSVGARLERLGEWMTERFGVEPRYRWAAQDNDTTDGLPFVGPLHVGARHAYVATGFGGWGMSNGVMAGLLLAALISGEDRPWAGLYDPRRVHPVREAGPLLKAQASVAAHFVGDRFGTGGRDDLEGLLPGQAAVVKVAGERCAAYRDVEGQVHAVSALCSHMGCVVAFNDAERTWECPCHGSRFALDGSILQGPATEPLKRIEL
ncbi:FAD-dependent oxidoreductase [Nonomuraea recticatena]|uniref:FAD-dependent oxidoreductase n=1 Tax=Nonomuraea recticatena TaxID=46178 RepID=UPI003618F591